MKRMMGLLLSVLLFATVMGRPVCAEEIISPQVYHVYTTADEAASDEWNVAQRGAYLNNGQCKIARANGYAIHIYGSTKAFQYCDKVQLKLYVERSTSSSSGYTTYKSYSYTANNAYDIIKEIANIQVERGYYYRVRGVHSVTEGGTTETVTSLTNPLSYI